MKSRLPSISVFFLLAFVVLFVAILIELYCKIFYDLGILAKARIVANPLVAFFSTPVFFWISAYICRSFAINASGSNLFYIRESLQQVEKHPNSYEKISVFLSWRIAIVNAISSLLATFGGGSLGREGSSVHISASIFAAISDKLKKYFPKINLENWIYAGAGLGLAVAFTAPFAGLVYIVEKLLKSKSKNFLSNLFYGFVVFVILSALLYRVAPIFVMEPVDFNFDAQIFVIFFTALICGILAPYFLKISFSFYKKFRDMKSPKWHLVPIAAGFAVSIISLYLGVNSIGGGIKTVSDALQGMVFLDSTHLLGRIFSTFFTFIAGCAGGLVAPSIAIGASIGSVLSIFAENFDAKIFILCGMAGFLSPVLMLPFTTAIIIFESTGQSVFVLPSLLFASLISYYTMPLIYWARSKFKK